MLYQQDTVLRMIEMLGAAFRKLLELYDDAQAEKYLDDAYQRFCGISRGMAETLATENLIDMLTPERRMALSELLHMQVRRFGKKMELEEEQGMMKKALLLLASIELEDIARLRLTSARELLAGCRDALLPDELSQVLGYFVRAGALADAEDLLFELIASYPLPGDRQVLRTAGQAFYAELNTLNDEQLAKGGLPRDEIAQGLSALYSATGGGEDGA